MPLNRWNPHILDLTELNYNEDEILGACGVYGDASAHAKHTLWAHITQLRNAVSILMQVPGVTKAFEKGGLPLCYKLLPQLQPLEQDELKTAKFGGVPDLSKLLFLPFLQYDGAPSVAELVAKVWPRCGACHKPMGFIGQFDLGLSATLLHYLVCDRLSDHRIVNRWSGMGTVEILSNRISGHWWYVFVCPNASDHRDNPNYNAQVIVGESHAPAAQEDQQLLVANATREYMASIQPDISQGPKVKLMKVTGFKLGFELDPQMSLGCDLEVAIEEAMSANPDIFGGDSAYAVFGRPASQQRPERFYTLRGGPFGEPLRMSPLLHFTSSDSDVTYQLYGDMWSIDGSRVDDMVDRLYCKVDASCT